MPTQTISQVTQTFGVSTRTLRYYEQIGLLSSARRDDYAYRVYDEEAIVRLQQILFLRSLRIPLKKIAAIFTHASMQQTLDVFCESIHAVDQEIQSLSAIRDGLNTLAIRLNAQTHTSPDLLTDGALLSIIHALTPTFRPALKEEHTMDQQFRDASTLPPLDNVRILYLPPATVAASHYFGPDPESNAQRPLEAFARERSLHLLKPDLRLYGFNDPSPTGAEVYGYTFWLTIPDTLAVPAPLARLHFAGGLYAAHCIKFGDFHEWRRLHQWLSESSDYAYDAREPMGMHGCLEEQLNLYLHLSGEPFPLERLQLDLLVPIKRKDM
ncbi:MAG: effector binding domain-containing protein [Candidatus Limiplasma sp.]|nr:effector binding domain-containing protein [Candidatus Limiplasma sp.]